MSARWCAAILLAALVSAPVVAQSPDSLPVFRHILALDYTRVRPFTRSYDMVVIEGDSVVPIGRREVSLTELAISDSANGWLLVESRTGVVASLDSIVIDADLRPVRWRSIVGPATLSLDFTSDSTSGDVRLAGAARHLATAVPPDVIVSSSAMEMLAAVLPLASAWSDSASTLSVDVGGATTAAAALAVAREDSVVVFPGSPSRPCWLLTLTSGEQQARIWVDRETKEVLRSQTPLPTRAGAVLEYRERLSAVPAAP